MVTNVIANLLGKFKNTRYPAAMASKIISRFFEKGPKIVY